MTYQEASERIRAVKTTGRAISDEEVQEWSEGTGRSVDLRAEAKYTVDDALLLIRQLQEKVESLEAKLNRTGQG